MTVHVTYKEITDVEIEQAKAISAVRFLHYESIRAAIQSAMLRACQGVTGEMYVAGEGLARLYLNRT